MSPAKVIQPNGEVLYVRSGEEITHMDEFKKLSESIKSAFDELCMFGMKDGLELSSMNWSVPGTVVISTQGISYKYSTEKQWSVFQIDKETKSIQVGKIRIVALTEEQMDAEIAAHHKPTQKER